MLLRHRALLFRGNPDALDCRRFRDCSRLRPCSWRRPPGPGRLMCGNSRRKQRGGRRGAAARGLVLRAAQPTARAADAGARRCSASRSLLGRDAARRASLRLRDICPHRGMPLSAGRLDGGEVECRYHGWRFAADGRCTAIPSLAAGQRFDRRAHPGPRLSGARGAGQYLGVLRRRPGGGARTSRSSRASPSGGAAARRERALRRRDRPRRRRADGPGARPLCPSRLVVALAPLGPRKGEGVRALALRLHDDAGTPRRAIRAPTSSSAARRRPRSSSACRACASSTSAPGATPSQPDRDDADRRARRPRSTTASIGRCRG